MNVWSFAFIYLCSETIYIFLYLNKLSYMIKDIVDSFKDNVSQKASNPLLATILIVWTFKNWRLLYGLLFFDKDLKLNDRIDYIDNYYSNVSFYENLGITVIYSFIALVGTYVLLSIARVIVDYYNKVIVPYISKLTDKSSVVLKSEYLILFKQNEELERKYSSERETRIKAKNDLELFETKYAELVLERDSSERVKEENEELLKKVKLLEENSANFRQLKDENIKLRNDRDKMLNQLDGLVVLKDKYESVIEEFEKSKNSSKESKFVEKLEKSSLKEKFLNAGISILNYEPLAINDDIRYFVSLDLINYGSGGSEEPGTHYFEFSPFGKNVYSYIIENT